MKTKVTITLDKEKWKKFRIKCIREGISASAKIEEMI